MLDRGPNQLALAATVLFAFAVLAVLLILGVLPSGSGAEGGGLAGSAWLS